jgi:hypothetical protein
VTDEELTCFLLCVHAALYGMLLAWQWARTPWEAMERARADFQVVPNGFPAYCRRVFELARPTRWLVPQLLIVLVVSAVDFMIAEGVVCAFQPLIVAISLLVLMGNPVYEAAAGPQARRWRTGRVGTAVMAPASVVPFCVHELGALAWLPICAYAIGLLLHMIFTTWQVRGFAAPEEPGDSLSNT